MVDHDHDHETREQSQLGPSQQGSVMLDIGGDVGALIIRTGPELLLAEIEVGRTDGETAVPPEHERHHGHSHGGRTHVAVRERVGPSGTQYAAIYPGLRAGEYTVWGTDGKVADTIAIAGGQITTLDWR